MTTTKRRIARWSMLLIATLIAGLLGACQPATTTRPADSAPASQETQLSTAESYRIGIVQIIEHPALDAARDGFIDGLAALGLKDGEQVSFRIESAQGELANATTIANQFNNDKLDLILAIATPAAQAVANVIKDVPVLVTAVTDPAAAGIAESNEAPGRNVSGTSDLNPVQEQFALLKQLVPDAKRVAIMYASNEANSVVQGDLATKEAEALGLESEHVTASSSNELQQVVQSVLGKFDAIYVPTDNLFAANMTLVGLTAAEAKMPIIAGEENMMRNGGLATVSLDYYRLGEQTAAMAKRILIDGAKPAEMPIEYQTDPQLVLNLDYAERIGFTFPEELLAKAETYASADASEGSESESSASD